MIRVVLQLGLLCGFLLLKFGPKSIPPNWFVILWVVVANLCVTQMTVILGGFPSQYYNGLNLVYLTAAVIVPVSWPSHLTRTAHHAVILLCEQFSWGDSQMLTLP